MKNLHSRLKLVFILGILIVGSNSISQSKSGFNQELDGYLSTLFIDTEPGGAVQIVKAKKVIFSRGYGVANLSTMNPITPSTIFNLGSISKTFVANGILILEEEGKLKVTDPLNRYFEDFADPELIQDITLEHLMSHCSGLPDIRSVSANPEFYLSAKDEENFSPLKKARSLKFVPGSQFEYSNPAYNGLALIIEKVVGVKWQSFIQDRILIPSKMLHSTITDGSHPESGVAHAYVLKNGKYTEYDYGEYPTFAAAGNGGVWSSVVELAKYESALQSGIFLQKNTVAKSREVFKPVNWNSSQNPFIGYSWFCGQEQLFGDVLFNTNFIYHTGSQGGFRAFYVVIPEHDLLLTGTFNRPIGHDLLSKMVILLEKYQWLE